MTRIGCAKTISIRRANQLLKNGIAHQVGPRDTAILPCPPSSNVPHGIRPRMSARRRRERDSPTAASRVVGRPRPYRRRTGPVVYGGTAVGVMVLTAQGRAGGAPVELNRASNPIHTATKVPVAKSPPGKNCAHAGEMPELDAPETRLTALLL